MKENGEICYKEQKLQGYAICNYIILTVLLISMCDTILENKNSFEQIDQTKDDNFSSSQGPQQLHPVKIDSNKDDQTLAKTTVETIKFNVYEMPTKNVISVAPLNLCNVRLNYKYS